MNTPPLRLVRTLLAILSLAAAALAAEIPKRTFSIPAGEAVVALKQFGAQSGQQLICSGDAVKGVTTNAVRGEFTAREALDLMTAGTRLTVTEDRANGALAVTTTADPKALRAAPIFPLNFTNPTLIP
jgi:iron complex outermembrane receptor protein